MSTWRMGKDTPCPITDLPAALVLCNDCPYFRGASSSGLPRGWVICCNWPRSGSSIAVERPGWDVPIPDVFRRAFEEDDETAA